MDGPFKRVVIIPDVHGRSFWKNIVNENPLEDTDFFVFLGDYCDSFVETNKDILDNLKDIIEFKKTNMEKVILLLGNHDIQYSEVKFNEKNPYLCSGYRMEMHPDLYEMFSSRDNRELFQTAFQLSNYIFTHAGISSNWFFNRFYGNRDANIADQLNEVSNRDSYKALFDVGYYRGGPYPQGGPYWCDKSELEKPLGGYVQVVGHTRGNSIKIRSKSKSLIWFVDCIPDSFNEKQLEYLTLDIDGEYLFKMDE